MLFYSIKFPVVPMDNLHKDEKNNAESSEETSHVPMFVYKHEEKRPKTPQTERKTEPRKSMFWSRAEERSWEGGLLEGYDSEEEIGEVDGRVDYDRLNRYISLMMPNIANGIHTRESVNLGSFSSQKSYTDSEKESQLLKLSGLSNGSSNKEENITRKQVKLPSPSLNEQRNSSSLLRTNDTSRGTDSCHPEPQMEEGLIEEFFVGSPVQQIDNTSNKPESVNVSDALVNHSFRSSSIYPEYVSKIPWFTKEEVVLHPTGASNHPDLSTSYLFPAVLKNTKLVAIKKIARTQFNEEAYSIWFRLKHESLITLLGMVSEKMSINLVLEFPENGSLKEFLLSGTQLNTWEMQLKWIQQLAEGLLCLHTNRMAHQKVCSENCLIFPSMTLKLSISSTLVMAKVGFEKAKTCDVFSFAIVGQELLRNSGTGNMSKPKISVLSLMDDCCQAVESQRPTMYEVMEKLQETNPNSSNTFSQSLSFDIQDQRMYQQVTELSIQDSGFGLEKGTVESVSNSSVSEQMDFCVSRESAFSSDGSQKGKSNSNAERITSNVLTNPLHGGSQAANPTTIPTAENTTNSHLDTDENTELGDSQNNIRSASDESANDRSDSANRKDGDQDHKGNGKEDEELGSHLCPPKVIQLIDHRGGKIILPNCDIFLEVPPGALSEGQKELITLSVDWNDQHIPPLDLTEMNVAPIVHCGPTGLQFLKPVLLQIPHCAVIGNLDKYKATVRCSQTEEGLLIISTLLCVSCCFIVFSFISYIHHDLY